MEALMCPQCGANINLDDTREFGFCNYCGAKIQINETIIHEHRGEIKLNGFSTVQTLCKKGFMEIDSDNFIAAANTFDKAAEVDCSNTFVIIGKMLTKIQKLERGRFNPIEYTVFDEFYYKLLKSHSIEISTEEMRVINEKNCKAFLKCYCLFGDRRRADFVVSNFPQSVSIELINYKHFYDEDLFRNNITFGVNEKYCHYIVRMLSDKNPVDVIEYMLNAKCNPLEIFHILYHNAYCEILAEKSGRDKFYIDILPLKVLCKLINAGLDPFLEVTTTKHNNDEWLTNDVIKCNFCKLYLQVSFEELLEKNNGCVEYLEYLRDLNKQEQQKRNKKNKGCYIATCVYGSYDCPQVWTLRRFRDRVLAKTWYGRLFVLLYYSISPKIVKVFGKTTWFKKMWITPLNKFVFLLNKKGFSNTRYYD